MYHIYIQLAAFPGLPTVQCDQKLNGGKAWEQG